MKNIVRNFSVGLLFIGSVGLADSLDLGEPFDGGGPIIVEPFPGGGHGGGPVFSEVERKVVQCASSRYRYAECFVRGRILQGRLLHQVSAARCVEGRTFEIRADRIAVDRGCRGYFEVYVQTHGHGHGFPVHGGDEEDQADENDGGFLILN